MQEVQPSWIASSGRMPWTKEFQKVNIGGSRRRPTSAESHGRINSSTANDQGEELRTEDQRQDQLIDEKGSRSGPSPAEIPGEVLHRPAEEGMSFASASGSAEPPSTIRFIIQVTFKRLCNRNQSEAVNRIVACG